ncbi:sugar transporter [Holotrichia oblita]|uniref:Sugar transporter n=1 Tax=Holotrichia oblita TaxID=644536 RepID=A0ACB9SJD2_HOLOL|nr:sugar transporter [Holotrichia oblita]
MTENDVQVIDTELPSTSQKPEEANLIEVIENVSFQQILLSTIKTIAAQNSNQKKSKKRVARGAEVITGDEMLCEEVQESEDEQDIYATLSSDDSDDNRFFESIIEEQEDINATDCSHLSDSVEIVTSDTHLTENIDQQINGRRFVDIQDFFTDMQKANDHSPYTYLDHMYMCSESGDALICSIKLKCRMCQTEKSVRTEAPGDKLNVLASISTGLCYAQTTQIFCTINMPHLSRKQFDKHFAKVSETILATSWEAMEEAGVDEGRIAREIGNVDKDGCPLISVIADGEWSKRSYNTKHDASAGVACIVGVKTGKFLFVAVRNKYCPICERSKAKNIAVSEHRYYKNWSGTSTAMESYIISEGFKRSMEMQALPLSTLDL